uniref:Uncharacterized protein n=1 Tax=Eutreptiella gymnastica TaxID=73025 RepID=A0A7S1I6P0_9EUGL
MLTTLLGEGGMDSSHTYEGGGVRRACAWCLVLRLLHSFRNDIHAGVTIASSAREQVGYAHCNHLPTVCMARARRPVRPPQHVQTWLRFGMPKVFFLVCSLRGSPSWSSSPQASKGSHWDLKGLKSVPGTQGQLETKQFCPAPFAAVSDCLDTVWMFQNIWKYPKCTHL